MVERDENGSGRGSRIRTRGLRIWNPLLYQLSYTPKAKPVIIAAPWAMQGAWRGESSLGAENLLGGAACCSLLPKISRRTWAISAALFAKRRVAKQINALTKGAGWAKSVPMLTKLRTSLANSSRVNRAVAGLFAKWSGLVRATSHVEEDGWDKAAAALEEHGAIIIVCWHQRLMMTPYMFDLEKAPCRSLTSNARAGRLVGWIHRHFGYETMPMPKGVLGAAEMRAVLKGLKQGISIGVSPDGPRGPAREAKLTPIQWARVSQVPVVNFTFSAKRYVTWPTWDRLMFPLPFTRIALTWRIWDQSVPERMSEEDANAMARKLQVFMDDCALEADKMVGHDQVQL